MGPEDTEGYPPGGPNRSTTEHNTKVGTKANKQPQCKENEEGSEVEVKVIDPKLFQPRRTFPKAKRVFTIRNKKPMFLRLEVRFANKGMKVVEFLIDTGAEVNLIRSDLVPQSCATEPSRFIRLVAANRERMVGGDQACQVEVSLYAEELGRETPQLTEEKFPAELFMADIQVDGILSYNWL